MRWTITKRHRRNETDCSCSWCSRAIIAVGGTCMVHHISLDCAVFVKLCLFQKPQKIYIYKQHPYKIHVSSQRTRNRINNRSNKSKPKSHTNYINKPQKPQNAAEATNATKQDPLGATISKKNSWQKQTTSWTHSTLLQEDTRRHANPYQHFSLSSLASWNSQSYSLFVKPHPTIQRPRLHT